MTADIAQTPEARQADARAKIAARENAIRANAIKQGIDQERKRQEADRAAEAKAHTAAIAAAEDAYRKAAQTAHRAGHAHGFWKGVGVGGAVAASAVFIGAAWYAGAVMKPAFEAAQQFRMQDQVVNQLDRSVNPPAPNYPSERP